MIYKRVYFTETAKSHIRRHYILSKEEIEEWLNNPRSDKSRMHDGFCLTIIIKRPKKHKVFVYYHEKRNRFEVFHVHLGGLDSECLDIKKKPKMRLDKSVKKKISRRRGRGRKKGR